ncbi:MAG: M3 family metallopeptidase [Terracidiphilus sp.]
MKITCNTIARSLLLCSVATLAQASAALAAVSEAATPQSALSDPAQGAVWDLTVLFADSAAADRERVAILADLPSLAAFQGHLGDNAAALRKALDRRSEIVHRAQRVHRYAFMRVSEDARMESSQALMASAEDMVGKIRETTAFFDPEIIAMDRAKVAAFEAAEPGLAPHHRDLELLLRRADHVLGAEAEAAIAASNALRQAPSDTHDVFTNAEMPWPTIDVHGKPTKLTRGTYQKLLADPDRETRRAVFEAFTGALDQFKNTQAALLQAHVAGAAYEAKLRHYPNSAAFLLAEDAMPDGSFEALSSAAEKEQATIDRYLRLRGAALGIGQLHSYDYGVPLTASTTRYSLAEGEAMILKALAPLGQEYVDKLSAGFRSKRMHAIAAPGKSPGAMTIPVDAQIPPFVMLTYTGDAESVETVAHEWGHAMHMTMAEAAQPADVAEPSVFIGDTPSLLNEMLLNDYMVEHAASHDERIAALTEAIQTLRGTYYRVLPMMRLEMAERAAADKGEPLTAERISKLACDQLRAFNGADRGVTVQEPGACLIWTISQEPYEDLYFYKYLNAVSAAAYFADGIEHGDTAVRDKFFALLKAGGSDDPYVLLKRAGFDAHDPAAYAAIGRRFEKNVDALETELRAAGRLGASSPPAGR